MSVWFTSDLHLGHAKVAKIRAAEAMIGLENPFDNQCVTNWHDNALTFWWDYLVKPDDHVWVLGDISSGSRDGQLRALEWIKERPGTKHLIAGNHDSCHPLHRDSHKWQKVYLEAFESVQMAARRRMPKFGFGNEETSGHHNVLMSHFPYKYDRNDIVRYPEWRMKNLGITLLHGHTHSPDKVSVDIHHERFGITHTAKQIHVGVDAWDYKPVNLDEIVKLVNE